MEASPEQQVVDETESPTSECFGDCLVCGIPAHGLHFGVLSCRACAAFYRRTVVRKIQYKCRRNTKNCPTDKKERHICRYCRFQKCIAVGMEDSNVRWNRRSKNKVLDQSRTPKDLSRNDMDLIPSSSSTVIDSSFAQNAKEDQQKVLNSLCIRPRRKLEETKIAEEQLGDHITFLLTNTPLPLHLGVKMSVMQNMLLGLHNLRRNQNPNPPVLLYVDDAHTRDTWHWRMSVLAEWAMHMEEFRELAYDDKMIINRSSRTAFNRLERIQQTISLYRFTSDTPPERLVFAVSPNYAIDVKNTISDISFLTDYDQESICKMFKPFMNRCMFEVGRPIVELGLTDTELAFMLGQITWHLEGKGVSNEALLKSITVRERMSHELHDHYVHDLRMTNYATRLMKIMTVVSDLENIMFERNKVLELAQVFDVFKHDPV